MLLRGEDALKPAGVRPVWGRDGLLVPKRNDNEATLFHSHSQHIDREKVSLKTFQSNLCAFLTI